jgi:acyl-CoA synthetase (AMP-forming)/AMP-acid ligase II
MTPETEGRISHVSEFRPWFKHYDPEVPRHLTYPHIPLYHLLDQTASKRPDGPCANFFGKRLTPYKVPSEVEFREQLPKTMIGQVLRRALREEEAGCRLREVNN